ncbi:hypothetical protein PPYR_14767 [Photinus pyralis]|uniref:Uncharacterized protein n=1 Tax=Photinus pyralis TaxID=7054 RepID=A0A5N4A6C1_PHOPY|nr:uncharacterized protein LOC116180080 [Photinus pyralis]KAB0792808.1 hypothetical protein PPYR_14767 [Photinus pyralis]
MFPQIFVVCALAAFASAGILEPSLSTLKFSVEEPSSVLRLVSPAITKTEFVPGSYSSSFRTDVIAPRLRLTETPAVSFSVPDSTIALARLEKIVPAVEKVERLVPSIAIDSAHLLRTKLDLVEPLPIARGYVGHAGLSIPVTRGVATGHVF